MVFGASALSLSTIVIVLSVMFGGRMASIAVLIAAVALLFSTINTILGIIPLINLAISFAFLSGWLVFMVLVDLGVYTFVKQIKKK